jgi:hypothetical protein
MGKEYASLRRKTFFLPFLIALSCALLLVMGGAWWHERRVRSGQSTLVVVMRHAEKALGQGEDPPLTEQGLARAMRLASMASDADAGMGFDAIYVTEWQRSRATVEPLVSRHGGLVTVAASTNPRSVVESIFSRDRGHRVLVVAHSDTVPVIVQGLAPGVTVPEMTSMEYGTTYLISLPPQGRATVLKLTLP